MARTWNKFPGNLSVTNLRKSVANETTTNQLHKSVIVSVY